jgi:UDP-N-acetylglucosamine transferase subunit ALG13
VSPLSVLVTVGSDHHPFDRLIGWMDGWLAQTERDEVSCVVQHGTAAIPRHGTVHAYLPHPTLQQLLRDADVVVTQGGPMGIVEARGCGTKPIAVPRLARLGEVVDDHQVTFCRQLASTGKLVLAEDATSLWAALDRAVAQHDVYAIEPNEADDRVEQAVERFGTLVANLPPRRGILRSRRRRSATQR